VHAPHFALLARPFVRATGATPILARLRGHPAFADLVANLDALSSHFTHYLQPLLQAPAGGPELAPPLSPEAVLARIRVALPRWSDDALVVCRAGGVGGVGVCFERVGGTIIGARAHSTDDGGNSSVACNMRGHIVSGAQQQ